MEPYTSFIDTINDIYKRFNSDLTECFLIVGDETKAVKKDNSDIIKTIISRTKLTLEKKCVNSIKIDDYANYLFMTNNRLNFKLDYNDRRFLMIECTNEKKDGSYYSKLLELLNNEDYIKKLFNYFKQKEIITDFTNSEMLKNDYKKETLFNNIKSYISFIYLNTTYYIGRRLYSDEFYLKSIEYAKSKNLSTAYSIQEFRRYITRIFKEYKLTESGTNRVYYNFLNTNIDRILEILKNDNLEYYNYLFNT